MLVRTLIHVPDSSQLLLEVEKLDSTMIELSWSSVRARDGSAPDRFVYELEAEVNGKFQAVYKGMALSWTCKQLQPRHSYKFRLRTHDVINNVYRFVFSCCFRRAVNCQFFLVSSSWTEPVAVETPVNGFYRWDPAGQISLFMLISFV
jgi:hypothetical protein